VPSAFVIGARNENDKSREIIMTDITGSCSSKLQSQTMVSVLGSDDHQVGLTVMLGKHRSPDPKWNGATMTYVGTSDIFGANGEQTGYFYNSHPNGDMSQGRFVAKVSIADGVMAVEGTWTLTAGAGTLATVSGGGLFSAKMTSATDSEMSWSGKYELG
jgi:hypothetical protein